MEMNDNTILRIKVPAHLYEAVKAQLTLKEGKGDSSKYGIAGGTVIKEKKNSTGESKKTTKHTTAKPKANAPVKVTPDNAVKADKETSKMGAGVSEAKKLGLEELKAIVELLNTEIMKLEEKAKVEEEKTHVEEKKEEAAPMEENKEEGHEGEEKQ